MPASTFIVNVAVLWGCLQVGASAEWALPGVL